jgi:hypothetical protein
MKKIFYLFIFFVLTLSAQAFAGKDEYICTILQIQALHSSGNFNTLDSYLLGKSFSIDRDTGEVAGKPFANKSYKEIRVLDRGNEKNSYKHIVTSPPPNILFQYVYVRESINGPEKPFWGTDDGDKVFSGVCK